MAGRLFLGVSLLSSLRTGAALRVRHSIATTAGATRTASSTRMQATEPLRVLVPIAEDSEEIETACITDTLVRAGAEVTVASTHEDGRLEVRMSRGLKIVADVTIAECTGQTWDCIALPGGMPGAERLRDCEPLVTLLKEHAESKRLLAAVCASPAVVLASHSLLPEYATCYPAPKFKEALPDGWIDAPVISEGHVITSQGPGTSLQFALKIVEKLYGEQKADELSEQMVTSFYRGIDY